MLPKRPTPAMLPARPWSFLVTPSLRPLSRVVSPCSSAPAPPSCSPAMQVPSWWFVWPCPTCGCVASCMHWNSRRTSRTSGPSGCFFPMRLQLRWSAALEPLMAVDVGMGVGVSNHWDGALAGGQMLAWVAIASAEVQLSSCMELRHWALQSSSMRQCMSAVAQLHGQQHPQGYCCVVATP